jgi:hypothetical protein
MVDEKGYQEAFTEAGEKIVAQEPTEDQEVACLNCSSTYFPRIPPSRFKNQALCRTHQDNKWYGCPFRFSKAFCYSYITENFSYRKRRDGI